MRRRKRHIFRWVALGLAVAATVPTTAQAKLTAYQNDARQPMELGLSEGKIRALGLEQSGMKSSDNRSFPNVGPTVVDRQAMELGLSEGKIRALGLEHSATKSPDDRAFSRATPVDSTPVIVSDADRTIDVNPYTVTGFGLAILFAMAVGLVIGSIRHTRGTKLSPA